MRKAEMMGFAEIVRQETTIKQRMILSHAKELKDLNDSYLKQLGDQLNRVDQVGTILLRRTETETVEDAARRVMAELAERQNPIKFDEKLFREIGDLRILSKAYDEALALCHEDEGKNPAEQIKFLRVEVDTLNVELENSRKAIATWSQSTEEVLHRLGSKQGESIDEALNRWLSEHTKNLQANRNTLRLYEAAMELCEGGMVPSEQIIKLRGLVNALQQQLADTAERAAIGQLIVAPRDQLMENDELRNANSKLREEVAALQEKLRASIQRANFAQWHARH